MTLNVRILAAGSEKELHFEPNPFSEEGPTLITMSPAQIHGHFKSSTLTSANTVIVVQPRSGLSLAVTDIIISGEKQAGSDVTIQFTDGVDTVVIFVASQVDAPPIGPGGLNAYFQGWKDARVEMITSGAGDATVTIGYLHSSNAPTFSEWDAER